VWKLDEPLIFLYNITLHKYGIYPLSSLINHNIQLEPILDYILSNHSQLIQYAGDSWSKRLARPFWELYQTIVSMFIEAPAISMLIIGVPSSIISIVCYCLCCLPNESAMDGTQGENDDDDDYAERTVQTEPKLLENSTKPSNAHDIPTRPIISDDKQKTITDKKDD
jgi:hypothetical protein